MPIISFGIHMVGKLRQAAIGSQCLELLTGGGGVDPVMYRACCLRQPVIREVTQQTFL
jgi:hypothetical protein